LSFYPNKKEPLLTGRKVWFSFLLSGGRAGVSKMDISELRKSNIEPIYHIDPTFINYRKCFSCFGVQFLQLFNQRSSKGDSHLDKLANDHLAVNLSLRFCSALKVKSLGEVLSNPRIGEIFASTHIVQGKRDVYTKERAKTQIILPYKYEKKVYLEFGTEHITCATGKVELSSRSHVTIIGELHTVTPSEIIIHPLLMGAPLLKYPENKEIEEELWLFGRDWYQCYPEEIDEFSAITKSDKPKLREWMSYMSQFSEQQIKEKFCEILGEPPEKDWAGEQADIFSCSLHRNGKRLSAAFLLKGPAEFKNMTPDMLGKRADQIYRLSCTPAELLIVQHCHTIGPAVRATLQAFAEQPNNPRRYSFIDGQDTYRILKSYGKL
jgi:hypothetical protein